MWAIRSSRRQHAVDRHRVGATIAINAQNQAGALRCYKALLARFVRSMPGSAAVRANLLYWKHLRPEIMQVF
jgi:hypothetical protein